MRASALGSQPDGMRWCDRILERMTGSHKQNSIRSSRQSSPRRKRRLPKRVYIMRRVVVLLVTVLWIVFVWLSVAGEARALFQARNLQASSNAESASLEVAFAEDGGPHAHDRRPLGDRILEIAAHAHRQFHTTRGAGHAE